MLIRESFSPIKTTKQKPQFQSDLIKLLLQIIKRQDIGNQLLQKMITEPHRKLSVLKSQNQLAKQKRRQQAVQKEIYSINTINHIAQDNSESNRPHNLQVQDRNLQKRIQESKKKLSKNRDQLMKGISKALYSLDSKKSITPESPQKAKQFAYKIKTPAAVQVNKKQDNNNELNIPISYQKKLHISKSHKAIKQNSKKLNQNSNEFENSQIEIQLDHEDVQNQGQTNSKAVVEQNNQNDGLNLMHFQQSIINKNAGNSKKKQARFNPKNVYNSPIQIQTGQVSPTTKQFIQSHNFINEMDRSKQKQIKLSKILSKRNKNSFQQTESQLQQVHTTIKKWDILQFESEHQKSDNVYSQNYKSPKNAIQSIENYQAKLNNFDVFKIFGQKKNADTSKLIINKNPTLDQIQSIKRKQSSRQNTYFEDSICDRTLVPSTIARQSQKNLKNSAQLFKQVKILDIPWTLVGKTIGIEQKNNSQTKQMSVLANNFRKLKKYSRLDEIQPYSDKREIKVRVSFYQLFINAGIKQIDGKKQFQTHISEWLGITYRTTASIGWNMLKNHSLDFEQVKILFTENIIFNYIQLMKDIRKLGLQQLQYLIPEVVNNKTVDIINFLCKQYPQTKVQAPNMALRDQIPVIDEKGRIQYQLVRSSGVNFTLNKGADYASNIMLFINYLIDVSNEHYDAFQNFFSKLFNKLFLPQNVRNHSNSNQNLNTYASYMQKVKKYTKFIIGRKIPKNTPKYTTEQIENGMFFIKSSAILRVISKWVEDLIDIVKNPDAMIRDWFHPFKNHEGNQQFAQYPIRKGIYNKIIENKDYFYSKIDSIRKTCFKIEGQLCQQIHISDDDHAHLSEDQMNVGLFSSNIKNALSSFLCQQLNQVMHFLLAAPLTVNQKKIGVAQYFEGKARYELDSINLITFRIFDLLRCKCISGQAQVVWLINQLKRMDKQKGASKQQGISIVRFKDRLSQGSRDILINLQIGKSPLSQLQLSVTNQVQQKQDLLDKYNHFLYELKRATMLGPLVENVSIWTSLQQKSTYFDEVVRKKFEQNKIIPFIHKCGQSQKDMSKILLKLMQPMTCTSCKMFFHIPKTCLLNWYCNRCKVTVCGQCLYAGLNSEQRKKRLFSRIMISKQVLLMLKQFNPEDRPRELPKNAFFFKKRELKPQLCYMTSYTAESTIEKQQVIKSVQTIIKGDKLINRSLIASEQELKKLKDYIIFEYKPSYREYMNLVEIQDYNLKNQRLRIVNLLRQPNFMENIKQISNQKKKMKLFSQLQKIIGQKKIQVLKIKKILILIQVHMDYHELEAELVRHQNLNKLKDFADSNSSVISIQRKSMTNQIDQLKQQLARDRYTNLKKHVTKIYLNYNQIRSIQSLSFFTFLQSLSISDNKVQCLKGVQSLTHLKILNFDRNKVASLEPIRNLIHLEYLMGNQNKLTSMKDVERLRKLKEISLHANQITKLESLQKLSELQILFITNNQIELINQIQIPKRLEQLTLSGNKIKDFTNLGYLQGLKFLSLCQLKLQAIPQEISKLTSIQELDLSFNLIEKIEHIDKLVHLKKLKMKSNRLKQISNIDNLKLTHLNLENNQIVIISGLVNILDTIEELNIRKNPVQDIGDLDDIQIQFKILWDKNLFKPKARFALESAFKNSNHPMGMLSMMLKSTNLKSSSLGQSQYISGLGLS